jgi:hypothetical protein
MQEVKEKKLGARCKMILLYFKSIERNKRS